MNHLALIDHEQRRMFRAAMVLALVVGLIALGASKSRRQTVAESEAALTAAGFVTRPGNTPEPRAMLSFLPPHLFIKRRTHGAVTYIYADPWSATVCTWEARRHTSHTLGRATNPDASETSAPRCGTASAAGSGRGSTRGCCFPRPCPRGRGNRAPAHGEGSYLAGNSLAKLLRTLYLRDCFTLSDFRQRSTRCSSAARPPIEETVMRHQIPTFD